MFISEFFSAFGHLLFGMIRFFLSFEAENSILFCYSNSVDSSGSFAIQSGVKRHGVTFEQQQQRNFEKRKKNYRKKALN